MLFFLFLFCIPIKVIAIQVKSLMTAVFSINEPASNTHFSSETMPFTIGIIQLDNGLLFRELPSSVFQLYFNSLKIPESNACFPVIVLYFEQRNTEAVPLERKIMKDFCRLNCKD